MPPQYLTYEADTRSAKEIFENYNEQASILNPYIDFFYLDVLSSVNEIEIAIKAIKEVRKTLSNWGAYFRRDKITKW